MKMTKAKRLAMFKAMTDAKAKKNAPADSKLKTNAANAVIRQRAQAY